MSVYRDTNASVVFEHPFPGPLTASVYRNGVLILEAIGLTPVAGRYTLPLTYRETQYDGELEIRWSGLDTYYDPAVPFLRKQFVQVSTPLVPITRLRTLFKETNWTDPELAEIESNVRRSIEAYTGQNFRYEVGSKFVTGSGEKRILLPMRLAKLNSVTGGPVGYFSVSSDGWSLYIANKNWLTVKEMPPEEFDVVLVSGVIHVPDVYWKQFRAGTTYEIDGEWGYPSVPEDVQEAALLLANDYACGDNLYRDRYLEAIKSGDWNMTFSQGAWAGTGNARADALLQKYRRQGMVII